MPGMGRPTKLTPEIQSKIVDAVKIGNYPEVAAQAAGVGERTYYRWMEKGEEASSGIYRQFWQAIKEASAVGEVLAVESVRKHMGDNWQSAMTYLERRHPQRWARMQRVEHTGLQGKDLFDGAALLAHPTLAPLTLEDRRRVAAGLRKALPLLAAAAAQEDEDADAIEAEPDDEQSAEEVPS